jgi:Divergent InlB B-repeat domain
MRINFELPSPVGALVGLVGLCYLCLAWPVSGQPATYAYDGAGNAAGAVPGAPGAPIITAPPQPELIDSNSLATFSVGAAGWGLSYQWLSNGIPILGATGDSLVVGNLPLVGTNLGNFSVIISNAYGVVTSTPAALWPDANGNGIPDWWEIYYFGNLNQTALGDYDGDGVNNLNEYLEGTNPTNRLSFNPRLHIQAARGSVTVSPNQPYYTLGQVVSLTAIPDPGQGFVGWSGAVTGNKPTISLFMNTNESVVANFGFPLGVALDNTNLVWTTTGDALWFGQAEVSADGISSAQSGPIVSYWDGGNFVGDETSLQTTFFIPQAEQLGFWWTVSSQPPDGVTFSINSNRVATLSGQSMAWQNFQTNLAAGVYTLTWTFSKGPVNIPDGILYVDAAWVDQVTLTAAAPTAPTLEVQRTGPDAILLYWPVSPNMYRLQQTVVLNPASWTDTTNTVNEVNGTNQVSVGTVGASSFYRLVYP